jgi:glycosyltransferase involved in cell wall biosynthesis
MHVALTSPAWPPGVYVNGVMTYVGLLRQALLDQGHQVTVFTPQMDPEAHGDGVELVQPDLWYRIGRRLGLNGGMAERSIFEFGGVLAKCLARVHRERPIDVIELEESFGFAAAVKRELALPVVVKLHGPACLVPPAFAQPGDFGRERIEREGLALSMADAVMAPSVDTLERALGYYGLSPVVAAHVVNPGQAPAGAEWSLEGCEPRTLAFIGRFDDGKGGDLVLRAFRRLLDRCADARLVFAGPDYGVTGADGERIGFEAFVHDLFPEPLRERVSYLGRVEPEQVAALRTRALATVSASRWDNQPYTVLEAMLQACPVIATDVGGTSELIVDGLTGRLVASQDVEALAAAMWSMIDDPVTAARLGAQARSSAVDRHAPARVAAQTLAVYRQAIDRACALAAGEHA